MIHYNLTPQERTQIDGRWHNVSAPLCATGDGHYVGALPGQVVTCPRCIEKQGQVAPRERNLVRWGELGPKRYWLGGPCEENGQEVWLVVDGYSTPSNAIETIVFQGTEAQCRAEIERRNT